MIAFIGVIKSYILYISTNHLRVFLRTIWNINQQTNKTEILPRENKQPMVLAKMGNTLVYTRKICQIELTERGAELFIPVMTLYW